MRLLPPSPRCRGSSSKEPALSLSSGTRSEWKARYDMPQDTMGTERDQLSLSLYIFCFSPLSPSFNLSSFISLARFDTIFSNIFSYSHSFLSCMLSFVFILTLPHSPIVFPISNILPLHLLCSSIHSPHEKLTSVD